MCTALVVPADLSADRSLGFLEVGEILLPDTLLRLRSEEALDHAVLLRCRGGLDLFSTTQLFSHTPSVDADPTVAAQLRGRMMQPIVDSGDGDGTEIGRRQPGKR